MRSGRRRGSGTGRVAATALVVSLLGCGESSPARSWLGPMPLESYDETASSPALALDARGDAVVLWQQLGKEAGLWSNRLVSGRWTGAEPVQLGQGVGSDPRVATNESGLTFGLWEDVDLALGWNRLRCARRLHGASWETPVAIDGNAGRGDASYGDIAVFADGSAVVVWWNFSRILSNRFDPQTGWGSPEVLSTDVGVSVPLLRTRAAGDTLALWSTGGSWVARH